MINNKKFEPIKKDTSIRDQEDVFLKKRPNKPDATLLSRQEIKHRFALTPAVSDTEQLVYNKKITRHRPTLAATYATTTIGPDELNCRVRNGNGCCLIGISTGKKSH